MFNKNDWNLLLVNYINPIPEDFVVYLNKIYNEYENSCYLVDKKIIKPLNQLFKDSKNINENISIFSGYRDIKKQIQLISNSINNKINNRIRIKYAKNLCFETLAIPGFSEHHTGLAVDLYSSNNCIKDELAFENTSAFSFLKCNAHKYGFILRYPKEKENLTNISYEPWHFRYVGKEAATVIYNNDLCLEEFIEKYI